MTDREFYVVTTATGEVLNLGDAAQPGDGTYANRETAEQAAVTAWSLQDGQPLHIVRCTHVLTSVVTGTTQVVVDPV